MDVEVGAFSIIGADVEIGDGYLDRTARGDQRPDQHRRRQ
jgi:hypothetical protein